MNYDISILNNNNFIITQFYGVNSNYYRKLGLPFHIGIDLVSQDKKDWTIESVKSGIVKFAGFKKDYGNLVIILQDDNILAKYMHLEKILVTNNQKVNQLQEVGIIGNTGNSTGRHLHLEFSKWDGNIWSIRGHFNPIPYLQELSKSLKRDKKISDMTKHNLITSIKKAKFNEIENGLEESLLNAANQDNIDYIVAFSGKERLLETLKRDEKIKELEIQINELKQSRMFSEVILNKEINKFQKMPLNNNVTSNQNYNYDKVVISEPQTAKDLKEKQISTKFKFSLNKQYETFIKSGTAKYLLAFGIIAGQNLLNKMGYDISLDLIVAFASIFGLSGITDNITFINSKFKK